MIDHDVHLPVRLRDSIPVWTDPVLYSRRRLHQKLYKNMLSVPSIGRVYIVMHCTGRLNLLVMMGTGIVASTGKSSSPSWNHSHPYYMIYTSITGLPRKNFASTYDITTKLLLSHPLEGAFVSMVLFLMVVGLRAIRFRVTFTIV